MTADAIQHDSWPTVAYFSMEIAVDPRIPTYSGGLGILAGDTLRAAADLGIPMVAVTLVHRKGYFRQQLDAEGSQSEADASWEPADLVSNAEIRAEVELEGRRIAFQAWRYAVQGISGYQVPVYLLDANLAENAPEDRAITDHLYGGDPPYRLLQEGLLGLGGYAVLQTLGYRNIARYHMNEGHSAFLCVSLLQAELTRAASFERAVEQVREQCVFTTHTPVAAGHDRFPEEQVERLLGAERAALVRSAGALGDDGLNMTRLALRFSGYVNGVAMRHSQVSHEMFPRYSINSITNGVHARTWTSPPFQALYDAHIPEWRRDNMNLRYAVGIPLGEVAQAHREAKRGLCEVVQSRTGVPLEAGVFTLGFARRATAYKRADLLFSDPERLRQMHRQIGSLQILYGGKAHPKDLEGKELIRRVFAAARALGPEVPVVYLEEYDMALAQILCAGVDLWLNTPPQPLEASGTSGMKAALNGVPSLSVFDGWWIEGHIEGVTGWSVGVRPEPEERSFEVESLHQKLERDILPTYYGNPDGYTRTRRSVIAFNASFFNTQRMVWQYLENAYEVPIRASGFECRIDPSA
ncbi:MAG TPA: alpha-glucan family phosphorylase [Myxococcota bacterium]